MAGGLVVHGRDGKILRINPAAERLLGIDHPESPDAKPLRNMRMLSLDGHPIAPEQGPVARALAGEAVQHEVLVLDGSPPNGRRCVSASAIPIRGTDGQVECVVASYAEVARLQQAVEQRDDLVRTISHDLRTPLSVLLLQAQMLQRTLAPEDRNAKRVDTIIANGLRLDNMIRDLVEMVRLENGQIHLARRPVALTGFISGLRERLAAAMPEDRVRFSCEPNLPAVLADPIRLEHMLVNLISNALKYSDPPSEVLVHGDRRDEFATITVTDRGVGIPRNELSNVFKRFYHTKDNRRQDGLGLGLTVTALLVAAHGGTINVESELGKGSAFCVSLPLELAAEP
jgi:signal transduction histidine kinase